MATESTNKDVECLVYSQRMHSWVVWHELYLELREQSCNIVQGGKGVCDRVNDGREDEEQDAEGPNGSGDGMAGYEYDDEVELLAYLNQECRAGCRGRHGQVNGASEQRHDSE